MLLLTGTPTTYIYTLSLHDALPICERRAAPGVDAADQHVAHRPVARRRDARRHGLRERAEHDVDEDRKSTRLNSSHSSISYAVFCLKKKTSILYLAKRLLRVGRPHV